jgi:hypothetical protein
MKKRYWTVFCLYECCFPCGKFDTLKEAIELCRWYLFEALFGDEMIIENYKGTIVRRFHWEDFNKGGKMYKPSVCLKCGSHNTVDIVFGYPTKQTLKKAERGEIHLGGCEITNNDPLWYCQDCKRKFGKIKLTGKGFGQRV